MAGDKEKTQRRVYVLPTELVERIVAYQNEMGLQSEVEAARRLLDDALRSRDDWMKITRRFQERLKETRVMADIAKDVLMGHPLVKGITAIENDSITFKLKSGEEVTVLQNGTAEKGDGYNRIRLSREGKAETIDPDEIPF